jgi:hypothetical protein
MVTARSKALPYMNIWEMMPCEGTGITADKIYRPRALMTREQAVKMLAIAKRYPKGTIRDEFLNEAMEVIRCTQKARK